jgi:general secretion pathway protein E
VVIADQKWRNRETAGPLLTLEALTEWLAGKVGLDYLHIDPLKIDFTGVAEVMSSAYAARFGILPVQVTRARWSSPPPSPSCANGKKN